MHVDEPTSREFLRRLVQNITSNPALWDDLLQEALIHLWITETRRPGQTKSWYLHSCKFHLLHYLASGRSVDSIKRRDGQIDFEAESDYEVGVRGVLDTGDSVLSAVCARELMVIKHRCKIASLLTRLEDPPRHLFALNDKVRARTPLTPQLSN